MILAAGLTPAWQQMLVFESLQMGEVNRAREAYWTASGKVVNVGLALHFLGGPTRTLSLNGGSSGQCIKEEFASLGVDCRWIRTRNRTRVCTTVINETTGETTELVENAAAIQQDEVNAYLEAYKKSAREASMVVLSGSLPPGAPPGIYRQLMELTPAGIPTLIDARGPELLRALPLRPFLVKPNRAELAKTFERELETEAALLDAVGELHQLGSEAVLITDGLKPAWLSHAGAVHRLHPLRVQTVNPVACGDCLAAAIAWALVRDMDLLEATRFGMAAAADNARMMLPSRLNAQRVRQLMPDVMLEPLTDQAQEKQAQEKQAQEKQAQEKQAQEKQAQEEPAVD